MSFTKLEQEAIIHNAEIMKAELLKVPLNKRPRLMSDLIEAHKLLLIMDGADHVFINDYLDELAYRTAEIMDLNYKQDMQ